MASDDNITSPDELQKWLEDKPVEWARIIALRLALRVFPMVLSIWRLPDAVIDLEAKSKLTLAAWRALFVSSAAQNLSPENLIASAAATSSAAATAAATNSSDEAEDRASSFATRAAAAAAATQVTSAAMAAVRAATASTAAVGAAANESEIWFSLAADRGVLSEFEDDPSAASVLAQQPLWIITIKGVSRISPNMPRWASGPLNEFERNIAQNNSWKLIVDWYRALLPDPPDQKPFDLLGQEGSYAIAVQSSDFWSIDEERTHEVVLAEIVQIAAENGTIWDPLIEIQKGQGTGGGTATSQSSTGSGSTTGQGATASAVGRETQANFKSDHPDSMVDDLARAPIAFQLAGRINQIWDEQTRRAKPAHTARRFMSRLWTGRAKKDWDKTLDTGFVVHIDAPWGGGKTNFAGFITRILNPWRDPAPMPAWLNRLKIDDDDAWVENYRRPWLVVHFNAWQSQHVDPPWWIFAETIRAQCAEAIRDETNQRERNEKDSAGEPVEFAAVPEQDYAYPPFWGRWAHAFGHWFGEFVWRLLTPAAIRNAWVAILAISFALFVMWLGLFSVENGKLVFKSPPAAEETVSETEAAEFSGRFELDGKTIEFSGTAPASEEKAEPVDDVGAANTFGILGFLSFLAAFAGAVWKTVSAFTTSLLPGTPDAAKNYSLGSGDPLERFRRHFAATIEGFKRPVVVVIDDLDRCKPDYVVKLIQGMQTIMVSPRIVYLMLGDRDWIEKAFAESNKAMAKIDVGPEHSFGGRFVEKAIQMSFVLPKMDEAKRIDYVRTLLAPEADDEQSAEETPESRQAELQLRQALEMGVLNISEFAAREGAAEEFSKQIDEAQLSAAQKTRVQADFTAKLAQKAATDQTAAKQTGHMLIGLAPFMPGNPRQIKRIINALTVLQQVARLREPDFRPVAENEKWQVLARWVVLMNEHPQSWYTLTEIPQITDWVIDPDKPAETGDEKRAAAYAKLISANAPVRDLLLFKEPPEGWGTKTIDSGEIGWLRKLAPATSGSMLELPKPKKPATEEGADEAS